MVVELGTVHHPLDKTLLACSLRRHLFYLGFKEKIKIGEIHPVAPEDRFSKLAFVRQACFCG